MPRVVSYSESWTSEAEGVCNRAVARHGGWAAWNQLDSVRIKPLRLSGLLPFLKGYQRTFTLPSYFEVRPKARKVILHDFPQIGQVGEFSGGDLKLIDSDKGAKVITVLNQARTRYRGLAKNRLWQPIDCLYFFGYAWTTYISSPFIFPSFKLLRSFKHQEGSEEWDALQVELPPDFDAHCRQQTFYFDQSGLLRRNDYFSEIVGCWAMAAHYSEGYTPVGNIQIALRRRVYVRIGNRPLPIIALSADLEAW